MRISHIVPLLLPALLLAAAPCDARQRDTSRTRAASPERRVSPGSMMVGAHSDGARMEHVWLDDRKGIEVRASGELDLREDAPDVESVSPRGYLIVQQRVGSAVHRAEWRPAAGGGVARGYTVDGRRRDFAEARPWLDRFFPEVLRKTSIAARARSRRVLAQRGVSGVLEEAAAAGSGRTRESFLEGLAERDLTPSETQRFIEALGGVSSSRTRREVLAALLAARGSEPGTVAAALASAERLPSSGDRREVLRSVAQLPMDAGTLTQYLDVVAGSGSPSDRREALAVLLHNGAALQTGPSAVAWLDAVRQLTSDSDKAVLLMASIGLLPAERPVRAAFSETLETLSSDTYYDLVATAYLRSQAEPR